MMGLRVWIALNGDPNGNENDAVDSNPQMTIQRHPGVQENGDLSAAHDWDGPIVKVKITRLNN